MDAVPLLTYHHLLLYSQILHIQVLPLLPFTCSIPAYTIHIAYVVEGGISYERAYQLPDGRLGGVVRTLP